MKVDVLVSVAVIVGVKMDRVEVNGKVEDGIIGGIGLCVDGTGVREILDKIHNAININAPNPVMPPNP